MKHIKTLQTWEQYRIKGNMGIFRCSDITYHWNWKFWKPVDCVGGKCWFGLYVEVDSIDWDAD